MDKLKGKKVEQVESEEEEYEEEEEEEINDEVGEDFSKDIRAYTFTGDAGKISDGKNKINNLRLFKTRH